MESDKGKSEYCGYVLMDVRPCSSMKERAGELRVETAAMLRNTEDGTTIWSNTGPVELEKWTPQCLSVQLKRNAGTNSASHEDRGGSASPIAIESWELLRVVTRVILKIDDRSILCDSQDFDALPVKVFISKCTTAAAHCYPPLDSVFWKGVDFFGHPLVPLFMPNNIDDGTYGTDSVSLWCALYVMNTLAKIDSDMADATANIPFGTRMDISDFIEGRGKHIVREKTKCTPRYHFGTMSTISIAREHDEMESIWKQRFESSRLKDTTDDALQAVSKVCPNASELQAALSQCQFDTQFTQQVILDHFVQRVGSACDPPLRNPKTVIHIYTPDLTRSECDAARSASRVFGQLVTLARRGLFRGGNFARNVVGSALLYLADNKFNPSDYSMLVSKLRTTIIEVIEYEKSHTRKCGRVGGQANMSMAKRQEQMRPTPPNWSCEVRSKQSRHAPGAVRSPSPRPSSQQPAQVLTPVLQTPSCQASQPVSSAASSSAPVKVPSLPPGAASTHSAQEGRFSGTNYLPPPPTLPPPLEVQEKMKLVEQSLSETRAKRTGLADNVTAAKREHSHDLELSELAKSNLDKMDEKVKTARVQREAAVAAHDAAERAWKEQCAALQEAESTATTSARHVAACESDLNSVDMVIRDLHYQVEAWKKFFAAASMLGRTAAPPVATSSSGVVNSGKAPCVTDQMSGVSNASPGIDVLKDACAVGVHTISPIESSSSTVRGNVESGEETSEPEEKSHFKRSGKHLQMMGSVMKKPYSLKNHIRCHSGMSGGDAMDVENDEDGVEDDADDLHDVDATTERRSPAPVAVPNHDEKLRATLTAKVLLDMAKSLAAVTEFYVISSDECPTVVAMHRDAKDLSAHSIMQVHDLMQSSEWAARTFERLFIGITSVLEVPTLSYPNALKWIKTPQKEPLWTRVFDLVVKHNMLVSCLPEASDGGEVDEKVIKKRAEEETRVWMKSYKYCLTEYTVGKDDGFKERLEKYEVFKRVSRKETWSGAPVPSPAWKPDMRSPFGLLPLVWSGGVA